MPNVERVVLATGNRGKLEEMRALLADLAIDVVAQSDLSVESPPETGTTFVDNALLKARHAAEVTGLPAMADDSGLVVRALGGRPGVYSARYAGENASDEDNVDKLLREMLGAEDRAAYFHCALVLVSGPSDAKPIVVEASWHGEIAELRRGEGGFGYDPVFIDPELKRHSAELPAEVKNERSHRGQALKEMVERLQASKGARTPT